MEEAHLTSLGDPVDSDSDVSSSFDIHSSDEVASSIDETQNELIRLSTYLNIESEHENDNNDNFQWPSPPQSFSSPSASDVEESTHSNQTPLRSESTIDSAEHRKSAKRKRRQWTVKEKLDIIFSFEECKNKRQTAKKEGCTSAQLRNWVKNKDDLLKIYRRKKG
jgi:CENP-B N-terminal DNA-binding domain